MSDELVRQWTAAINEELDRLVPIGTHHHRALYEAARYSLLSSGKRIRPLLTLATVSLFKGPAQKALTPACALEMIHTYSLIHDDLPCMDDDDFRRGQPTLHRVYTEGHAVLVGDFLLTYAFEILSAIDYLEPKQTLKLISILAKAAGGEGMIGGQVLDIAAFPDVSLKELHSRKTGALFIAAIQFGGIVANCSQESFSKLTRLGAEIGYLFQVVDDVLDNEHGFAIKDAQDAFEKTCNTLETLPGDKTFLLFLLQKILHQLPAPVQI